LLSESSEEELTPRQARRTVEDLEEEDQDMQPEANGSAVPKAPAPEAAEATARAMSIADQIAFGKKNVTSLFQVNDPPLLLAIAAWLQCCPLYSSCHLHLYLCLCPVSGGSYAVLCCAML